MEVYYEIIEDGGSGRKRQSELEDDRRPSGSLTFVAQQSVGDFYI